MPELLPQRTYKDGIEVQYGIPGGVRPDFVSPDGLTSVEVKNYDIANNAAGLVRNVADQGFIRARELPPGMTQTVQIDITGQDVSDATRSAIQQAIETRSLGTIKSNNIDFFVRK